MEVTNVFTGKTVDSAIEEGLAALNLKKEEANIVVLEEGKKKLFGSVKAKVQITKKQSNAQRAVDFVDGLFDVMKLSAVCEIVEDGESIKLDVKTTNSARLIGKHGDILDAIQCIAGAVANIGRDEYVKVVVDCENYREQREETLKALALKLAKKAVEKGRKMTLEPMPAYERRIIHATLADSEEVKTVSEGKEPARYIAVIPNNAKPNDKGLKYGGKKEFNGNRRDGGKREFNRDRKGRGDRRPSSVPAKKGKKEIHFGTFLGNSGSTGEE